MGKAYKITVPIPGVKGQAGKNKWIDIGIATKLTEGEGFRCRLNAIPLNWTGEFFIYPLPDLKPQVKVKGEDEHEDQTESNESLNWGWL